MSAFERVKQHFLESTGESGLTSMVRKTAVQWLSDSHEKRDFSDQVLIQDFGICSASDIAHAEQMPQPTECL